MKGSSEDELDYRRSTIFRLDTVPAVAQDLGIDKVALVTTRKGLYIQITLFIIAVIMAAAGVSIYDWALKDPKTGIKSLPDNFNPQSLYVAGFILASLFGAMVSYKRTGTQLFVTLTGKEVFESFLFASSLCVSECLDVFIIQHMSPLSKSVMTQAKLPFVTLVRAIVFQQRPDFREVVALCCVSFGVSGYIVKAAEDSGRGEHKFDAIGVILLAISLGLSLIACVLLESYAKKTVRTSCELLFVQRAATATLSGCLYLGTAYLKNLPLNPFAARWNWKLVFLCFVIAVKDTIGCLIVCRLNVVWKVLSSAVAVVCLYCIACVQSGVVDPVEAVLILVALLHIFMVVLVKSGYN